MVLEYQLQTKCFMLIRKHGIQLLSAGPRSTFANVARQLILCGGRRMRWVCIIVLLHIGRALCNHNRQVLPKIPRSGRHGRCFDVYQLRQLEKRYTGGADPVVHHCTSRPLYQQTCCWPMLRGLAWYAHSYFSQHVVLMKSRYIRCGVSSEPLRHRSVFSSSKSVFFLKIKQFFCSSLILKAYTSFQVERKIANMKS